MKKNTLLTLLCWFCALLPLAGQKPLPSIAEKTASFQRFDGFVPFFWDAQEGQIYLEISQFDSEFLYVNSLPAGLGSNDIGLDRGQLGQERIVFFNRVGKKVMLVQPNYRYRAQSSSALERQAVAQSFASSTLAGFTVEAEEKGRVLVNATEFLLRDAHQVGRRLQELKQGQYNLSPARSAIYLPRTKNFPQNTELEATITFTSGGEAGEYLSSVAPSTEAITLRMHHSFVQLPDANYTPRVFDARSSYIPVSFYDYATPVDEPIEKFYIMRHRLKKKDPNAKVSEPIKPIVYYLDNGTPEPIRSALLEGATWWNEAFEAAGFKNAFQVKILPDSADPMDVRYNVINWVHRSTRGWSYGASVTDPRTGEIIKGHVSLGSLRVRQDYLIATGLLAPFENGEKPKDDKMMRMALQRLKQLSAHEVGHTLGLMHNYAASTNNRASVMDYPHPTVKIDVQGRINLDDAYATGIGVWDKVSIAFGYQDFPKNISESKALDQLLLDADRQGLRYLSDRDARAVGGMHPEAHLWDNGSDVLTELAQVNQIRAKALEQFSEKNIRNRVPMAMLEEVLVPIYNYHRYQTEAVVKWVGGVQYRYALRGDGQAQTEPLPRDKQVSALQGVLQTIDPTFLTLPERVLRLLPPRPAGYDYHRELFKRRTGLGFDPLAAAEAAADFTVGLLCHHERASRLVELGSRGQNLSLEETLQTLVNQTFKASRQSGLAKQVQQQTEQIVLTHLMALGQHEAASYQARAVAQQACRQLKTFLEEQKKNNTDTDYLAHVELLLERLKAPDKVKPRPHKEMPPGAPIGCDAD
jgi:Met-zincin/Domain of unknown function (DUF5117)